MMKVFFKTKGKIIVLLIAVCQLFITSCSRPFYPESSFRNIESNADRKKLNDFMAAGIEKGINTHNASADEIIETAQKYLGVAHCMGGTTMKCMDCSGLLVTVFASHDIQLPHNSEEQARYGKIIAGMHELKKGDLVFFIRTYETHLFITHSGIYAGNNKFIHASSRRGVTITSLNDPWWNEKFIFGTRVLE
jgi:murein DD-endopeptidase / murein LD-carboxypeptidase